MRKLHYNIYFVFIFYSTSIYYVGYELASQLHYKSVKIIIRYRYRYLRGLNISLAIARVMPRRTLWFFCSLTITFIICTVHGLDNCLPSREAYVNLTLGDAEDVPADFTSGRSSIPLQLFCMLFVLCDSYLRIMLYHFMTNALCPTAQAVQRKVGFGLCKIRIHNLLGMPVGKIPTFSPKD